MGRRPDWAADATTELTRTSSTVKPRENPNSGTLVTPERRTRSSAACTGPDRCCEVDLKAIAGSEIGEPCALDVVRRRRPGRAVADGRRQLGDDIRAAMGVDAGGGVRRRDDRLPRRLPGCCTPCYRSGAPAEFPARRRNRESVVQHAVTGGPSGASRPSAAAMSRRTWRRGVHPGAGGARRGDPQSGMGCGSSPAVVDGGPCRIPHTLPDRREPRRARPRDRAP
jgi:hypothetical protein